MEKLLGQNANVQLEPTRALEILLSASRHLKSCREQIQNEIYALDGLNKETEICVAIFAPLNSGKSTLINSLVGTTLLPANIIRTTACPIAVKYGRQLEITVIYQNGERKIYDDIAVLKSFAVLGSPMATSDISLLEVTTPLLEHLRGFKFLDLPGTKDKENLNQVVKLNLLRADIVVQIINAHQQFSQQEMQKTRQWLFERGIDSVIFLVNFMNLEEKANRRTILGELKRYFRVIKSDLPLTFPMFYVVDVLPALKLKLSGEISCVSYFETGLPQFQKMLQMLMQLYTSTLVRKRSNRCAIMAKKVCADLEQQAAALRREVGEFVRLRNEEIRKGQLNERHIKNDFNRRSLVVSEQLSYYSLRASHYLIIADRLKQGSFEQWEKQFLNSVGRVEITTFNEIVKKASAHYGFSCTEFRVSQVAAPEVKFPPEPTLSGWEQFKNLFVDIKGRKMDEYNACRDNLALEAADDYLKRFSSKALEKFNSYTAKVNSQIKYHPPAVPRQMLEKENYERTLQEVIHSLTGISETNSISVRAETSVKSIFVFIYIRMVFLIRYFVEKINS